MPLNLVQLPPETLFKIFLHIDSPKCVLTVIPRVCKTLASVLSNRSNPILANVEIISEEEDANTSNVVALVQSPEAPTLLQLFKRVRVVGSGSSSGLVSQHRVGSKYIGDSENSSIVYVGIERTIKVHVNAIPETPSTLVQYISDLLRRGLTHHHPLSRSTRVLFGTIQVAGRRNPATPATLLGNFLQALKPCNITLWWWDSDLIANLPTTAATCLRLPNMRGDGNIQARDISLLSTGATHHLKRLELFRPMPRQPWGLEASAFTPLSSLHGLRHLVIRSGRLIGSQETLVTSLLLLPNLTVLELPWNIDARLAARILGTCHSLESFQYIQITSPDFFLTLPTATPLRLQTLGLNFVEPDSADIAVMVEGLIRCLPHLTTLLLRINSRPGNDTTGAPGMVGYDFYGSIPRDSLVRWLRRLEAGCPRLVDVGLELGLRMWGSRKSYADQLVDGFVRERMRVRVCSPVGRIG
ncbi:hypothetical protein HDU98_001629 [Podochytrium sp. JEL0797]|nr:hypothetical protein HDU98_001629 [Podochytrium sp. JEL0797]